MILDPFVPGIKFIEEAKSKVFASMLLCPVRLNRFEVMIKIAKQLLDVAGFIMQFCEKSKKFSRTYKTLLRF